MTSPLRAVGVIHTTAPNVDTAAQTQLVARLATEFNLRVIGWAEDLDSPAETPPWMRPELKKWLDRPGDWDALIVGNIEELAASMTQLLAFALKVAKDDLLIRGESGVGQLKGLVAEPFAMSFIDMASSPALALLALIDTDD